MTKLGYTVIVYNEVREEEAGRDPLNEHVYVRPRAKRACADRGSDRPSRCAAGDLAGRGVSPRQPEILPASTAEDHLLLRAKRA
jgi:hypothetical protein